MIEEELKQEAEKSLDKRLGTYAYIRKQDCYTNYVDGYIDGAEPREKRIAELEKENAELENDYKLIDKSREHLVQEKYNLEYKIENLENKIEHHQEVINTLQKKNAELSEKLNRHKHDCPNCSAFGKHCPHRVNGDPYTYDCYLTVAELEKENAELNEKLSEQKQYTAFKCNEFVKKKEIYEREHFLFTTAKEIIREFVEWANWQGNSKCPSFKSIQDKAEQFLK